mmetsp:Transcript_1454/g.3459  ORF Transcript_1454/g.3459 Transcript_1454/m.3459 type:complete len:245 (+) Transcript_1454:348-1082(+)
MSITNFLALPAFNSLNSFLFRDTHSCTRVFDSSSSGFRSISSTNRLNARSIPPISKAVIGGDSNGFRATRNSRSFPRCFVGLPWGRYFGHKYRISKGSRWMWLSFMRIFDSSWHFPIVAGSSSIKLLLMNSRWRFSNIPIRSGRCFSWFWATISVCIPSQARMEFGRNWSRLQDRSRYSRHCWFSPKLLGSISSRLCPRFRIFSAPKHPFVKHRWSSILMLFQSSTSCCSCVWATVVGSSEMLL